MNVCFDHLLRTIRYLCLVIGVAALSYSSWIYLDGYWKQVRDSHEFDNARVAQVPEAATGLKPFSARLTIPRLHLVTMVKDGVGEDTLSYAAGHIPGTAVPGRPGNIGIAAHRDSIFSGLRGIRKHDRILLSTSQKDYYYLVVSMSIVNPEDVSVLVPSAGQNTLTLVTCYPFHFIGQAPKRFIVRALQIEKGRSRKSG